MAWSALSSLARPANPAPAHATVSP